MTLTEAISLADEVQSRRHRPVARVAFNKLQGSATTGDFSARAEALRKSRDRIGNGLSDMTMQLSKIAADVEFLQNFSPSSPIRRMQS
jgi:hypothetical protein